MSTVNGGFDHLFGKGTTRVNPRVVSVATRKLLLNNRRRLQKDDLQDGAKTEAVIAQEQIKHISKQYIVRVMPASYRAARKGARHIKTTYPHRPKPTPQAPTTNTSRHAIKRAIRSKGIYRANSQVNLRSSITTTSTSPSIKPASAVTQASPDRKLSNIHANATKNKRSNETVSTQKKNQLSAVSPRNQPNSKPRSSSGAKNLGAQANSKMRGAAVRKSAQTSKQAASAAAQKATARLSMKLKQASINAFRAFVKGISLSASGLSILVFVVLLAVLIVCIATPIGILFASAAQGDYTVAMAVDDITQEYRARIDQIIADAQPVDEIINDYEGDSLIPNWRDILCVYAVWVGASDDQAMSVVEMDETRAGFLRQVFWSMNDIEWRIEEKEVSDDEMPSSGELLGGGNTPTTAPPSTENGTGTREDGLPAGKEDKESTRAWRTLYIQQNSSRWEDGARQYTFNADKKQLTMELMRSDYDSIFAELIGGNGSESSAGMKLTQEQYAGIISNLPAGTKGAAIVEAAFKKLGDPYEYGSGSGGGPGKKADCSAFTRWAYAQAGAVLPRTAADQAKYCSDNGFLVSLDELQAGDLVFFGGNDSRWMNIGHVGIYVGDGMIIDSSSSRGEVVYRKMWSGGSSPRVMMGRPHIAR